MSDVKVKPEETPLLAWDSCVFINALGKNKPNHAAFWADIEPMQKDAEDGKIRILVSEMSVAEVCVGQSPKMESKKLHAATEAFFFNPYIVRKPVDSRISALAGPLIRAHNLNPGDAIIIANALFHKAKALYTTDGRRKDGTDPCISPRLMS